MRQLLAINGKGEHPGGIIALLMDHRVRDTGFKGGVVGILRIGLRILRVGLAVGARGMRVPGVSYGSQNVE